VPLSQRKRRVVTAVTAVYVVGTIVARRKGYRFGLNLIVCCREGHLFTTIWIPGISFKSLRLGWWRLQRCPVGDHWSIVAPIREADLPEDLREAALAQRDIPIP
jgi:hypothetical protein